MKEIKIFMQKQNLFVFGLYIILVMTSFFWWSSFQVARGENIFVDSDQDGLSNEEERLYKTDPNKRDTDGDGYSDGVEVASGYDPLKPAPGDRLFTLPDASSTQAATQDGQAKKSENLTATLSNEISSVIADKGASQQDISLDELDSRVQEVLSGKGTEVALPTIKLDGLKIKKAPSSKLSDTDRKAAERDDAIKYLTAMSYIIAHNSPESFSTPDEFNNVFSTLSTGVVSSLSTGDSSLIKKLAENGQAILDETKDIEVPEAMLPIHIKGLQLATYAVSLQDQVQTNTGDPIGDLSGLMKVQSLLNATLSYGTEIQSKMQEYGINEIPVQL